MNDDLDRPADTRLMGIVHNALRRDLDRARAAISEPPFPADDQRTAIAAHLGWMMGFLHRHHETEDTWPGGPVPRPEQVRPGPLEPGLHDHVLAAGQGDGVADQGRRADLVRLAAIAETESARSRQLAG